MTLSTSTKIALSGALWFAFVATIGFPLVETLSPSPMFHPKESPFLRSGPDVETHGATNFEIIKLSLFMFAPAAALVGGLLANRILRSKTVVSCFLFGVLLVILTNVVAGPLFLGLGLLRGSPAHGILEFLISWLGSTILYFLFDIMAYKGIPFMIGGITALVFRKFARRISLPTVSPNNRMQRSAS